MTQTIGRTGYEQQLLALQQVLQRLQEQQKVESLAVIALDFLQSAFDYSLIWLALYDTTANELVGMGGTAPNGELTVFKQSFSVLPGDRFDQVLVTGRSAEITNLQEESRAGQWQSAARRFNIQGTLIHPFRFRDQSLGVVLMGSTLWGCNPRSTETAQLSIFLTAFATALSQLKKPLPTQKQNKSDSLSLEVILDQISNLPDLEGRLHLIVQHLHQLIAPTRTSLYWLESEQRLFQQRITCQPDKSKRPKRAPVEEVKIDMQDMGQFAHVLRSGQVIAVSDILGTVNASLPTRLMIQMESRSLLSAPILVEGQLLGFLASEGTTPRVWQEHEKQVIRSTAQLLSLVVGLDVGTANTVAHNATNDCSTQLLSALINPKGNKNFFKKILTQASGCLQFQWGILLQQDSTTNQFYIEDQLHVTKRRPITGTFAAHSDMDAQMLQNSSEPISIDNLEDDLRLLTWRESFLAQGMRSLLILPLALGEEDAFLLMGCDFIRTWTLKEGEWLQQIADALTVVRQQRQLLEKFEKEQQFNTVLSNGLVALQNTPEPEHLGPQALQTIVKLLQVPLVAWLQWTPGQSQGNVFSCISTPPDFNLVEGTTIEIEDDSLLQQLLNPALRSSSQNGEHGEWIQLAAEDLELETRYWLNCPGLGQLMAMLLTSSTGKPLGAIIVGDVADRVWDPDRLTVTAAIVRHLANNYRSMLAIQLIQEKYETLECLNWYKQRQVECLHGKLCQQSHQLEELISSQVPNSKKVRQNRIFEEMQRSLTSVEQLVHHEAWQFCSGKESIPLSKLLRQGLVHVDSVAKTKDLWVQVHNQIPTATVSGSKLKLGCILGELLHAACVRSKQGERIDIWCRLFNEQTLELAITDNGRIDPILVSDLNSIQTRDLLVPSVLDQPQGQPLKACQLLVTSLGGQMQLGQLEDGRAISRLILPLAESRTQ